MSTSIRSVLCLLCAGALLAGCDNPVARVRKLQEQAVALQAQNDRLQRDLKATSQRADELRDQVAGLNSLPPDRWALVPKPAKVTIDSVSGLRPGKPQLDHSPTTQPSADTFVRLYVTVRDGDNYGMHAVGEMKIALFDLAATQPRSLGVYRFNARALEGHFRTALTSDLFAFDLPLNATPKDGVVVRIEFLDYLTGKTLTTEKPLK